MAFALETLKINMSGENYESKINNFNYAVRGNVLAKNNVDIALYFVVNL